MNIFEKAVRTKVRFNYRGFVSVEDLWDLPLTKLDMIYGTLKNILSITQEESLLKTKTTEAKEVELKLEIIKHIVETRQAENEAKLDRLKTIENNNKIKAIIAKKKDIGLEEKSVEDLEKMIVD